MPLSAEQQAFEQITRAKRILITSKVNATNDTIASALACFLFLKKMGKDSDIVIQGFELKNAPAFLPAIENVRSEIGAMRALHLSLDVKNIPLDELLYDVRDQKLEITVIPKNGEWTANDVTIKPGEDRYDLVIALDSPDIASLGEFAREHADFLYRTTILNVDHGAGNEYWGQINLVNLNAVSTTEILFEHFEKWNRNLIDEDIATALLTGMIAKTKSFRSPNVTPKTLSVASQLTAMGARREQIVHGLWRTRTVPILKIWGRALARLEQDKEAGLIWSTLTRQDFIETGTDENALKEVIDELISYAPEAKVVAFIYEPARLGPVSVFVHANPPLSAIEITRQFNATGTRENATFNLGENASLVEETKIIIEKIKNILKK